jgi:hypothetical protein
MEGTVKDITLIVAKEIITLTIFKVTEVRAQEVCAKGVRATKETSMDVAVKEVTSIVSDSQMIATTIVATPGQHLPSDITTVINLSIQILYRTLRDANGRLFNLSAAVSLEVSIADQVFKRTLLVAPQLSVSLILGTAFMKEHVKSLLPRERLMVLISGVSVSLVDDTRRSTSAVKLAQAYVIPPKTEVAVLVKADREVLSLLKSLYVKGRLLYAFNGVLCLPALVNAF